MEYNIHTAKSQLSKLIEAALAGEEVVISKGSKPVVRLTAIPQGGFKFGTLKGKIKTSPDFLGPMYEDEMATWE
ncbi:type II toxin-antitoxin system Phd/YefM family antitoxin [Roseovarius sp. S4756]|uniref:type II toxin-antitoxin system Phd/YefM family antitoxin n=1 Tax=Roseovarius maritimus TaxID=3342637 RepID=UPI00372B3241